jgi:Zn-finger nucleic acid-binding protein
MREKSRTKEGNMKCSTCNVDLEVQIDWPVEGDQCPKCGRTWFEDDELRQAKDAFDVDLNWLDFELWTEWKSLDLQQKESACPGCGDGLVSVLYGNTGVQVDCCPRCKGLWLEKGVFTAIIDALTAELLNKPFSQYVKASLQEAKEIVVGPESLRSEWKDFKTVLRFMQYRLLSENPRLSQALSDVQASGPR